MSVKEKIAQVIAEDREQRERKCNKCGYVWHIHKLDKEPGTCPLCKSIEWNKKKEDK